MSAAAQLRFPETSLESNELAKGARLASSQQELVQRFSSRLSRGSIAMICTAGRNAKINSQRWQELRLDRAQVSELAGLCGL